MFILSFIDPTIVLYMFILSFIDPYIVLYMFILLFINPAIVLYIGDNISVISWRSVIIGEGNRRTQRKQVGSFLRVLRFPPPIITHRHNITEILLKVVLKTIKPNHWRFSY
jgi:hypothetical protein